MTAEHLGSAGPGDAASPVGRAEPDGWVEEVLRLFEGKAVTWPAKYGPAGLLAGRLVSLRPLPCPAPGAFSPLRLVASRCVDASLPESAPRSPRWDWSRYGIRLLNRGS